MPKPLSKKNLLSTLSPFLSKIFSFLTDSVDLAIKNFPLFMEHGDPITFS
jgi:hypothetical protein